MSRPHGSLLELSGFMPINPCELESYNPSVLPDEAPDIIARNTISVKSLEKVYAYHKWSRREHFRALVKRYKDQVQYGCQNPNCTTPTCFSYRKRISQAPVRRHTELSARNIAFTLASQLNPEDGLCGCLPAIPYDDLRADGKSPHSKPSTKRDASKCSLLGEHGPSERQWGAATLQSSVPPGSDEAQGGRHDNTPQAAPKASRKDPKSFTQNLFDTYALRVFDWLPLRKLPHGAQASTRHIDELSSETMPGSCSRLQGPEGSSMNVTKKPSRSSDAFQRGKYTSGSVIEDTGSVATNTFAQKGAGRSSLSANFDPVTNPRISDSRRASQRLHGQVGTANPSLEEKQAARRRRRVSFDNAYESDTSRPMPKDCPLVTSIPEDIVSSFAGDIGTASGRNADLRGAQSLTKLTQEIIFAMREMLYKASAHQSTIGASIRALHPSNNSNEIAEDQRQRVLRFVSQSVFYVLSSPRQLLKSFRLKPEDSAEASKTRHRRFNLDAKQLPESFRVLCELCPPEVAFSSLWICLGRLFIPPAGLRHTANSPFPSPSPPSERPIEAQQDSRGYVDDSDAAYIASVALLSLVSFIPAVDPELWLLIRQTRSNGLIFPAMELKDFSRDKIRRFTDITDKFEDELALRLAHRLTRAVSVRVAYREISRVRDPTGNGNRRKTEFVDGMIEYLRRCVFKPQPFQDQEYIRVEERVPNASMIALEWLRNVLLKEWDGKPEIVRATSAGGIIELLSAMYRNRTSLGLFPEDFYTPFFAQNLDTMNMPTEFLAKSANNQSFHLLAHSFLLPPAALVNYFRAINYSAMWKSYEAAETADRHMSDLQEMSGVDISGRYPELALRMEASATPFLLLVIRRNRVMDDALDQLWRREKRELMRPLKVIMGMNEGEQGVDHGGVQQEFFRMVMAEAMNPNYGLFTVDSRTYCTWFRPGSLEPLYKFELLGLLVSLAVYNGLTLPVNFPLALYMKLLDYKVKTTDHIRNGWPELAKGFDDLLTWEEGDVGDVFMRTYEFSYDAFGIVYNVDMEKIGRNEPWPAPQRSSVAAKAEGEVPTDAAYNRNSCLNNQADPCHSKGSMLAEHSDQLAHHKPSRRHDLPVSGILKGTCISSPLTPPDTQGWEAPPSSEAEASLVTNENRKQFVKDYIFWLTDKSVRPQYDAFARGFFTCIDRTALSIFTPEALKKVVEGIQDVDLDELEKHTRYSDGYSANHLAIIMFWDIVKQYQPDKKRLLLEFVTANDRVPVNGPSSMIFVIQRAGNSDERLPTSMTCFGRLMLPEYSSREVMEEKLDKALQNTRGFGSP